MAINNRYGLNICDMTTIKGQDLFFFNLMVKPAQTNRIVYLNNNKIDNGYMLVNESLSEERQEAICKWVNEKNGIRYIVSIEGKKFKKG